MKKLGCCGLLPVMFLLLIACTGNPKKVLSHKERLRQEIVEGVRTMKSRLPYRISNTEMYVTDSYIDGDMIVYVVSMSGSLFEEKRIMVKNEANSDKNIAMALSFVKRDVIERIVNAGLGIRYIYKDKDSDYVLMTIEASSERLKKIQKGMDAGEISPYSVLDVFQMEIDKYECPCKIGDGVWLTNGYIKDNDVYYIYKVDSYITVADITDSDLKEMKNVILKALKKSINNLYIKEMEQKGVKIIYVYKNLLGNEYAHIEITADDL